MPAIPPIEITIIYEGTIHVIRVRPNEYRNLMMLIYDRISTGEFQHRRIWGVFRHGKVRHLFSGSAGEQAGLSYF